VLRIRHLGRPAEATGDVDLMLAFIQCVREELIGTADAALSQGVASLKDRGYLTPDQRTAPPTGE
jgi:hypothetical protein